MHFLAQFLTDNGSWINACQTELGSLRDNRADGHRKRKDGTQPPDLCPQLSGWALVAVHTEAITSGLYDQAWGPSSMRLPTWKEKLEYIDLPNFSKQLQDSFSIRT